MIRNMHVLGLSLKNEITPSEGHPLTKLDLEGLYMIDFKMLKPFKKLTHLNIRKSNFHKLPSLKHFKQLVSFDAKDSQILEFTPDIFEGLTQLKNIHSSNYKLCCQQILPSQVLSKDCHSPMDEISSCDNLLR